MKPKCRIKITLACNRDCTYCINRSRDYSDKWIKVKAISDIPLKDYRTVIVSGGEPTMSTMLYYHLCNIKAGVENNTPIYLQTNGYGLTKALVKDLDNLIDGIGLSVHDFGEFRHLYTRYEDINKIKQIRIYVENKAIFDEKSMDALFLKSLLEKGVFRFRIWTAGEFDSSEHIYVLEK
jgi:pyruvate-formate lyase-activating enzyme